MNSFRGTVFLTAANERLFQGEPMTLVVREEVGNEEVRRLLSSPGVQYLRDDNRRGAARRPVAGAPPPPPAAPGA